MRSVAYRLFALASARESRRAHHLLVRAAV
jgi:hypothetical protein